MIRALFSIGTNTPVERATIEATEAFELIYDLGFGLVYRLRR